MSLKGGMARNADPAHNGRIGNGSPSNMSLHGNGEGGGYEHIQVRVMLNPPWRWDLADHEVSEPLASICMQLVKLPHGNGH